MALERNVDVIVRTLIYVFFIQLLEISILCVVHEPVLKLVLAFKTIFVYLPLTKRHVHDAGMLICVLTLQGILDLDLHVNVGIPQARRLND